MQLPELLGSAVQHGEGCFVGNLLFSGLNVVAEHTDQDVRPDEDGVDDSPDDDADQGSAGNCQYCRI